MSVPSTTATDGREAIVKLLEMGHAAGVIPQKPNVEFACDDAAVVTAS